MKSNNKESNIKNNIAWNTFGNIYYSFCQWFMTIVIIYLTDDYGVIGNLGLAMTITNSFTTISSFGMRSFQISDVNHQYSDSEYVTSRRITATIAFMLCFIYSISIGSNIQELACIMSYMILRLIESTEDVYQGILQINNKYDIIGKSYIIRGSLQIMVFIVAFGFTKKLELTFLLMVLSNLPVFICYDIKNVKKLVYLKKIFWTNKLIGLYRACLSIVVYNFLSSSLVTMVRVNVKKILGSGMLGLYSTIASPTVIVQLASASIFSPFIPLFAKAYNQKNIRLFKLYIRRIIICIFVGFIIVTLGALVFGELGLKILYNDEIASHVDLLLPLVWCTFFAAASWLFAAVLISIRETSSLIIGAILAFILDYLISGLFINNYGLNGASFAQIISLLFLIIYQYIFVLVKSNTITKEEKNEIL